MFKQLIELKHLMEDMETICNSGRVLNPSGETWQDMAYLKANEARRICEKLVGEAEDKLLNP